MKQTVSIIPIERVENRIFLIRDQKVIIDSDLARLYGVSTSRLNEQVKRNSGRFPPDFMFRINRKEFEDLKSQFATSSSGWGGRRKLPYAFTEHGALMAANVLNSKRAVEASIFVVRAFAKLRQMLSPYKELASKLKQLENKLKNHDKQIITLVRAIRLLMPAPAPKPSEPFGFRPKKPKQKKSQK